MYFLHYLNFMFWANRVFPALLAQANRKVRLPTFPWIMLLRNRIPQTEPQTPRSRRALCVFGAPVSQALQGKCSVSWFEHSLHIHAYRAADAIFLCCVLFFINQNLKLCNNEFYIKLWAKIERFKLAFHKGKETNRHTFHVFDPINRHAPFTQSARLRLRHAVSATTARTLSSAEQSMGQSEETMTFSHSNIRFHDPLFLLIYLPIYLSLSSNVQNASCTFSTCYPALRTIVIWDLREPSAQQKTVVLGAATCTLRLPAFTSGTNGTCAYIMKIIAAPTFWRYP